MHVILLDTECTVILKELYQWELIWENMPKRTWIGELNLHRYSTTSTWHFFLQPSLERCQMHTHLSGDIHLKAFKMNILQQTPVRITVAKAALYLDILRQQDWKSRRCYYSLASSRELGKPTNILWDQKEPEPEPEPSTLTELASFVQSFNSEVHFLDPLKPNCLVYLMPAFYLLICIWGTC